MDLKLDQWATVLPTGFPGAIAPSTGKKQEGFANGEEPAAGHVNHVFQAVADVQQEVRAAIEGAGLTLSNLDNAQLDRAVKTLIGRGAEKRALSGFQSISTGVAQALNALASDGTSVVAVGNAGAVTSWAGTVSGAWVTRAPGSIYGGNFAAVYFDAVHNLWIAGGAGGEIQTAPPAMTPWTRRNNTGGDVTSIAGSAAGVIVAGMAGAPYLKRSADGVTYTSPTPSHAASIHEVAYGAGVFVAVTVDGYVMYSVDGTTWTTGISSPSAGGQGHVAYHPDWGFIATYEQFAFHSINGMTWTSIQNAMPTAESGFSAARGALVLTPHAWRVIFTGATSGFWGWHTTTVNAAPDFKTAGARMGAIARICIFNDQAWAVNGADDKVYVSSPIA
ncbi:MAG TPA: hypothetical protein VGO53_16040 [Steroidobacteraceae bacterium]|jgi:hypothetical protein|nr:hypothetical protein [Steroidobacteraceae bacterium]